MSKDTIQLGPFKFVHILDVDSMVTTLHNGPTTIVCQDHQRVVRGPDDMVKLPPKSYCIIENPVQRDETGKLVIDPLSNQAKLRHGEIELRTVEKYPEPFPLYPGEYLQDFTGTHKQYTTILKEQALVVNVVRSYTEGKISRVAGERYLVYGPATYIPRIEEEAKEIRSSLTVRPNTAVLVQVNIDYKDEKLNVSRRAGQRYLYRTPGSFLPRLEEEVVTKEVKGFVITDKNAVKLRANKTFTDFYGIPRKSGDEWLITSKLSQFHIVDVHETLLDSKVKPIVLSGREYCVIKNPVDNEGRVKYGHRVLRKGEDTFFLHPPEEIENGVQRIRVLGEEESLLIEAQQDFREDKSQGGKIRSSGERWLIKGPCEYIPPIQVQIKATRKNFPLDSNEGIYVRNLKSGDIRLFAGKTYSMEADEELWEKPLPEEVERILYGGSLRKDKTKAVCYRAPDNTAVQIFDFKTQSTRVVLGPSLIMLNPSEEFTVLSISGGDPKREDFEKVIALPLGQFSIEDFIQVETVDHAQLDVHLTYHCQFKRDEKVTQNPGILFNVRDYIGDACKSCASRIRGAISTIDYNEWHHSHAEIVMKAVFGSHQSYTIPSNNLCILSVDVRKQNPTDKDIQNMLNKHTSIAIDVKAKASEAQYRHKRAIAEQESKGQLEKQRIEDLLRAQDSTLQLTKTQTESRRMLIESQKLNDVKAVMGSKLMVAQSKLDRAKKVAETTNIEGAAEIDQVTQEKQSAYDLQQDQDSVEVKRTEGLAKIEAEKFQELIRAIGKETIVALARAGPAQQAKLLGALGLKGYLVTDGKNPINLFNTANSMVMGNAANASQ